jgi:hypothetical protein
LLLAGTITTAQAQKMMQSVAAGRGDEKAVGWLHLVKQAIRDGSCNEVRAIAQRCIIQAQLYGNCLLWACHRYVPWGSRLAPATPSRFAVLIAAPVTVCTVALKVVLAHLGKDQSRERIRAK